MTGGDAQLADDVAQEVAVKALRNAQKLRKDSDAWMQRAAFTTTMDHIRRRRRQAAADTTFAHERYLHDEHASEELDPAEQTQELQKIAAILAPLTERQRAAMTLRYVHDLTDQQIAKALGCRIATVRSLLHRAAAAIRDAGALPSLPDEDS